MIGIKETHPSNQFRIVNKGKVLTKINNEPINVGYSYHQIYENDLEVVETAYRCFSEYKKELPDCVLEGRHVSDWTEVKK